MQVLFGMTLNGWYYDGNNNILCVANLPPTCPVTLPATTCSPTISCMEVQNKQSFLNTTQIYNVYENQTGTVCTLDTVLSTASYDPLAIGNANLQSFDLFVTCSRVWQTGNKDVSKGPLILV